MGRRKNRERAAAGQIFREGRLWDKEEWEKRNRKPDQPRLIEAVPLEELAERRGHSLEELGVGSDRRVIVVGSNPGPEELLRLMALQNRGGIIVVENRGR